MIIDLRGRKPVKVTKLERPMPKPDAKISMGDQVEVEVVRNGNVIHKGR